MCTLPKDLPLVSCKHSNFPLISIPIWHRLSAPSPTRRNLSPIVQLDHVSGNGSKKAEHGEAKERGECGEAEICGEAGEARRRQVH